jgi:hypothetical protein
LILCGSLLGIEPLAAIGGRGADGATLVTGGGLLFWFNGGNTKRTRVFAVTSTGNLPRDELFSAVAGHDVVRLLDAADRAGGLFRLYG